MSCTCQSPFYLYMHETDTAACVWTKTRIFRLKMRVFFAQSPPILFRLFLKSVLTYLHRLFWVRANKQTEWHDTTHIDNGGYLLTFSIYSRLNVIHCKARRRREKGDGTHRVADMKRMGKSEVRISATQLRRRYDVGVFSLHAFECHSGKITATRNEHMRLTWLFQHFESTHKTFISSSDCKALVHNKLWISKNRQFETRI